MMIILSPTTQIITLGLLTCGICLESTNSPKNLQFCVETPSWQPTNIPLKSRGIPVNNAYPFCELEDESTSHLFLFCPFAKAIWHGTTLVVHTSDFDNITVQQWIGKLLLRHNDLRQDDIYYLQVVFTTLWTIWDHRNLVVHEGKVTQFSRSYSNGSVSDWQVQRCLWQLFWFLPQNL